MARWLVLMVLVVLASATQASARGPQGVAYTLHNLSDDAQTFFKTTYATTEKQICVFCHTPHGGANVATNQLWNRSNPGSSWTHYNSITLSPYLQGLSATRAVNQESLLCLSCHDGSVATNRVINPSAQGQPDNAGWPGMEVFIESGMVVQQARIGDYNMGTPDTPWYGGATGHLEDEHPISFSYESVRNSLGGAADGKFNTASTARTAGVQFFGPTTEGVNGNNRVECSSCHDPHVNYDNRIAPGNNENTNYWPFLIMSNDGSKLCLACHNK